MERETETTDKMNPPDGETEKKKRTIKSYILEGLMYIVLIFVCV